MPFLIAHRRLGATARARQVATFYQLRRPHVLALIAAPARPGQASEGDFCLPITPLTVGAAANI